MDERSIVGSACGWVRFPAAETPAPIVSDEVLDELGRAFVSFGGQQLLGITFEQYVRRQAWQPRDPRMQLRRLQRRAIDQLTRQSP